ncbi:NifU family protein [Alicyclobacillus macrosporangiidus]|jgi:Fe-S cluster biogenesis protein NfuA|uniref:Fe-S cluster biogenesis protein NfuA, 4Fe-4S-binding domain n=1 Tax=Alicyclobacillus macrosporangiidus TaxID=392015 RepID=A0A1I7FI97_9BACL|nr:NifU family protein [Alicyclobacillus macrosporangiidus]SFU35875.1 Fe-S cluster biogenesis protein NfuA, 4Fe-4S-binding domain [Alicyclobacillus macrosporangiidus]
MSVEDRIQEALAGIRDAIQMDGGDVEFVSYDDETKTVYVSLTGSCVGCPASVLTLKMGVERAIKAQVPEVENVEAY